MDYSLLHNCIYRDTYKRKWRFFDDTVTVEYDNKNISYELSDSKDCYYSKEYQGFKKQLKIRFLKDNNYYSDYSDYNNLVCTLRVNCEPYMYNSWKLFSTTRVKRKNH